MKKHFRKNYLINPKFQLQIISACLLLSFLVIAIIYSFNTYYFEIFIQKGKLINLEEGHFYFQLLKEQKEMIDSFFVFLSLIIVLLIVVVGVIISHKIAGPIHRLNTYFKNQEMRAGKELHFRKGDYFQETSLTINHFFKKE